MKFKKEKVTSLVYDGAEVRFTVEDASLEFLIIARPEGIVIRGESPVIRRTSDLEPLAKAIGDALKESKKLSHGLRSSLQGPTQ